MKNHNYFRRNNISTPTLFNDIKDFFSFNDSNNKFNQDNIIRNIKVINSYDFHNRNSIKQNIEDNVIKNINDKLNPKNIITKIEINKYYYNNNPEKKEKKDGLNADNIFNKKSEISNGKNYSKNINTHKRYNIFYNNNEKKLDKNKSKKILLPNYNLVKKIEKKVFQNQNSRYKEPDKYSRERTLEIKTNRSNIFSDLGKSILNNNRSGSLMKKDKTKLTLEINNDNNSIKLSRFDLYSILKNKDKDNETYHDRDEDDNKKDDKHDNKQDGKNGYKQEDKYKDINCNRNDSIYLCDKSEKKYDNLSIQHHEFNYEPKYKQPYNSNYQMKYIENYNPKIQINNFGGYEPNYQLNNYKGYVPKNQINISEDIYQIIQ